jgi:hypothetical protein
MYLGEASGVAMKLLFWLIAGFGISALAHSANLVMPKDLAQFAEASGCVQVEDFFDRAGPIDPPYLYSDSEIDGNAILWCKRRESGTTTPYLLLLKGSVKLAKGCSNKIDWWNVPGGLAVRKMQSLELSDFRYLSSREKRGPSTKQSGTAVISSYDGVETIFFCYQGNWLYTIKH